MDRVSARRRGLRRGHGAGAGPGARSFRLGRRARARAVRRRHRAVRRPPADIRREHLLAHAAVVLRRDHGPGARLALGAATSSFGTCARIAPSPSCTAGAARHRDLLHPLDRRRLGRRHLRLPGAAARGRAVRHRRRDRGDGAAVPVRHRAGDAALARALRAWARRPRERTGRRSKAGASDILAAPLWSRHACFVSLAHGRRGPRSAVLAIAGCSTPAATGGPNPGNTNSPAATAAGQATTGPGGGGLLVLHRGGGRRDRRHGPVKVEERAGRGDCDYFLERGRDAKVNIGVLRAGKRRPVDAVREHQGPRATGGASTSATRRTRSTTRASARSSSCARPATA